MNKSEESQSAAHHLLVDSRHLKRVVRPTTLRTSLQLPPFEPPSHFCEENLCHSFPFLKQSLPLLLFRHVKCLLVLHLMAAC